MSRPGTGSQCGDPKCVCALCTCGEHHCDKGYHGARDGTKVPFAGASTTHVDYQRHAPCKAEGYKPDARRQGPSAPFEGESINQSDFIELKREEPVWQVRRLSDSSAVCSQSHDPYSSINTTSPLVGVAVCTRPRQSIHALTRICTHARTLTHSFLSRTHSCVVETCNLVLAARAYSHIRAPTHSQRKTVPYKPNSQAFDGTSTTKQDFVNFEGSAKREPIHQVDARKAPGPGSYEYVHLDAHTMF